MCATKPYVIFATLAVKFIGLNFVFNDFELQKLSYIRGMTSKHDPEVRFKVSIDIFDFSIIWKGLFLWKSLEILF